MSGERHPNGYWTFDRLHEEALKYNDRGSFQKGSSSAYVIARRNGVLDAICSHMKPSLTEAYTPEELQLEADKYLTRGDFCTGSPSAYVVAWKRDDFDKICAHMIPSLTEPYSIEEIEWGANQCTEYGEFKEKYLNLYSSASKKRILHHVCRHMKHSSTTSKKENFIFDIIKSIYPDTKKLIDRRVKIENKPYICGFHIDIFVPQLSAGIEFDGTYWHSFEYMRKNKTEWSDEDIANYHEIKDSWFASKDIRILHIKEEDWDLDRDLCIKRCLDFLSVDKCELAIDTVSLNEPLKGELQHGS